MDRGELVNDAERRLWDAFTRGQPVDLGPGDPTDEHFDPAQWREDRTVRAELITRLLLGVRDEERGWIAKVGLAGARITGVLDLNGGATEYELELQRCWLDDSPDLGNARTKYVALISCLLPGLQAHEWQSDGSVHFRGSHFAGGVSLAGARVSGQLDMSGATLAGSEGDALNADNLTVERDMFCRNGFNTAGTLNLMGARIGGQLDMSGAILVNPDGDALNAESLTIDQGMFCGDGFSAEGTVRLMGAKIGGQLAMSGATLTNPDGHALNAQSLTVDQGMFCSEGFNAVGTVSLHGAKIGGQLAISGATLTNPENVALNAENLTVEGNMFCSAGFEVTGAVRLLGAKVAGQLDMSSAMLTNPDGDALNADNLVVEQGMFFADGFTAVGIVRLTGAKVGGQLDMSGASLASSNGDALNAENLTVEQGMFCRNGFTATGALNLMGAKIGGQLDTSGATLTNPDGDALNAENLTVERDMFCRNGFTAFGTVRLTGAKVGGQLAMSGATLTNPSGDALSAENLTVEQDMFCHAGFSAEGRISLIDARLTGITFAGATLKIPAISIDYVCLDCEAITAASLVLPAAPPGTIDLRRASIGVLEVPTSALTASMRLSGLTYTDLDPDPDPPIKRRLTWLRGDPNGYHPQPYEQLAAYYRSNGHDREARRVLLGKRRARRASNTGSRPWRWGTARLRRLPGLIVDALAGYGYAPGRAFAWLLTALGAGTWLLYPAAPDSPTDNHYVNALLLAFDAILPTSPLGIREAANLTGGAYITAIALQGFGFAMSLAVLPALTRSLARADK